MLQKTRALVFFVRGRPLKNRLSDQRTIERFDTAVVPAPFVSVGFRQPYLRILIKSPTLSGIMWSSLLPFRGICLQLFRERAHPRTSRALRRGLSEPIVYHLKGLQWKKNQDSFLLRITNSKYFPFKLHTFMTSDRVLPDRFVKSNPKTTRFMRTLWIIQ